MESEVLTVNGKPIGIVIEGNTSEIAKFIMELD